MQLLENLRALAQYYERCTCHEAYKDRGLVAPDCVAHDIEAETLWEAIRRIQTAEDFVKPVYDSNGKWQGYIGKS